MAERRDTRDPRIEEVIADIEQRIITVYPHAAFEVFEGEDPEGAYMRAIVDIEDPDAVTDLVVEPLLKLQIEERLPLYFIAARPAEASSDVAASLRRQRPYVAAEAGSR